MNSNKRTTLYIMNLIDLFSIAMAFIVAYVIKFEAFNNNHLNENMQEYTILAIIVLLAYILVSVLFLYNDDFISRNVRFEVFASFKMIMYVAIIVIAFLFFSKISSVYSRIQLTLFLILAVPIDSMCRLMGKRHLLVHYRHSNSAQKMLIITTKEEASAAIKRLRSKKGWFYNIIGVAIVNQNMESSRIEGVKVVANRENLLEKVVTMEMDSAIIISDQMTDEYVTTLIRTLQAIGKTVHIRLHEYELSGGDRRLQQIGDYATVSYMVDGNIRNRQAVLKRTLDVMTSLIGIILTVILIPFVWILNGVESPGKVIISRVRVSKNGRRYYQYRFRIFRMDAKQRIENGKSPYTKNGFLLYKLRLDALPMSFNLLFGDLAFLGPKSPSVSEYLGYEDWQRRNLCVCPGVTGWWVEDEDETAATSEDAYLGEWNLFQDFRIFVMSVIGSVVSSKKRTLSREEIQEYVQAIEGYRTYNRRLDYDRTAFHLKITPMTLIYLGLKRLTDIILSLAGLLVLSPIFLVISILVNADDGGSPFYGHERVGKYGKKIKVYKFRSMRKDAGDLETLLTPAQLEQYKREFKIDNDPRITKVGNFLRKTSLDELPQLLNILKGDISIIGPRPIVEKETKIYGEDVAKLLSVKPGLTGYWQAYARNNATYESGERQKMEMYYVEHFGMWTDIKIFFKTIISVVHQEGAQ